MGLTKYTPPKASSAGAQLFFEKVLSCDSNNIKAFLALAFVGYDTDQDGENIATLKTVKTNDVQEQALLWYAQSFFYKREYDGANYENALTNSLLLYPGFVWPQVELANYYKKRETSREAVPFLKKLSQI